MATESSPIGVWTGNAKHHHAIGCRTVDTNLAVELSAVELCASAEGGITHPSEAPRFKLVVVDWPAKSAHDFCGFFAFTRLGVDDFHAALAQGKARREGSPASPIGQC